MRQEFDKALAQIDGIVLGKPRQTRLALTCLLAGGHLLIEDLPGVGKTTLAHALAQTLGLEFKRIQFTSDLLPADVLGYSVFDRNSGGFTFHAGPVFSQVVLADEINRATPKSQSALLEAMEENQVTLEGVTRALPQPFFVIATQNPFTQTGVYPLPESQLDRFLMRLTLGYPDASAERALLSGSAQPARTCTAQVSPETLLAAQKAINLVKLAEPLLDYLQALAEFTRTSGHYVHGLSPRAILSLARAAQAWAWLDGRDFVTPDDVQAVFPATAGHRLLDLEGAPQDDRSAERVLRSVAIP